MADIEALVSRFAQEHGVDPELVRRIIQAESAGNPRAQSKAGAQGLMQLMPKTAGSLGVTDPFDPEQNIKAGTKYLSQMLQRFGGDKRKALAAYNFGPTAVAAGRPWPAETNAYVDKVLQGLVDPPAPAGTPTPRPAPAPSVPPTPQPRPAPAPSVIPAPVRHYAGNIADTAMAPAREVGNFASSLLDRAGGAFNRMFAGARAGGIQTPEPMPTPRTPAQAATAATPPPEPQIGSLPSRVLRPLGSAPGLPTAPVQEFAAPPPEAAHNVTPPAVTSQVSQNQDPTLEALRSHASSLPRREDFHVGGWNKLLGVLTSAAAGYAGGPGQGMATAEHLFQGPYNRAVQDHRLRGEELSNVARIEDTISDRALRRQEHEQRGRYQDIMGSAATTNAAANLLEAQNRERFSKIGPEKVVPFGQLDQARQAVMERLFVTDARAKKYLQPIQDKDGQLTGQFTIKPEYDAPFWSMDMDRGWNPQELEELRQLLAEIDRQAQGFVGTMVDPYASRQRPPAGFGMMDDH